MMATRLPSDYATRREALATYFDSTARQAWIDLTSDAKVSGIRATVRAGRNAMRATLLDWLPTDLRRTRILDAGCGTGSLAVAAACRGAEVTGIDVAAGLVEVARQRTPSFIGHGRIHWRSGDMLDPELGTFAHVVLLSAMHEVGKFFPKSDRSPAIVPTAEDDLRARLSGLKGWSIGRTQRIQSGFYTSQALELVRHG